MAMKLYTYSSNLKRGDLRIPLPIQSTYLRNYANTIGLIFVLPRVEWNITGIYFELTKMILEGNMNIAMCSIAMLPDDNKILRELLSINKEIKYHFPLENMKLNADEAKSIKEELNRFKKLEGKIK